MDGTNLGSIFATLELKAGGFQAGLSASAKALAMFGTQAEGTFSRVGAQAAALDKLGTAALGMGAGIAAGLAVSMKAAEEWQKTIAQIGGNTTLTTQQLAKLSDQARTMASQTGASMSDLATAFMHATNEGYSLAQSQQIVAAANMSALSSGAKTADVARTLAQVLREMNIPTASAARTMDLLHVASANSTVKLDDFVTSGSRVFGIAGSMGLGLNDVLASLVTLTKHGFPNASLAATQMVGILQHVRSPSAQAEAALQAVDRVVGVDLVKDFSAFGLQTKGVSGVLGETKSAANQFASDLLTRMKPGVQITAEQCKGLKAILGVDLSDALKTGAISTHDYDQMVKAVSEHQGDWTRVVDKLIAAQRGGLGATALMSTGFSDLNDVTQKLNHSQGATTAAYDRWRQTAAAAFDVLHQNTLNLEVDFGNVLLPRLNEGVRALSGLIESFGHLSKSEQAGIVDAAAIGAGLLLVGGTVVKVGGMVSGLANTWKVLSGAAATEGAAAGESAAAMSVATEGAVAEEGASLIAFAAPLGPIAAVGLAMGALVLAWQNDWGGIREATGNAIYDIKSQLDKFAHEIEADKGSDSAAATAARWAANAVGAAGQSNAAYTDHLVADAMTLHKTFPPGYSVMAAPGYVPSQQELNAAWKEYDAQQAKAHPAARAAAPGSAAAKNAMPIQQAEALAAATRAAGSGTSGSPPMESIIAQAAARYGVDPLALIAVSMHESGLNPSSLGDYRHGQPTSFGLFQLHEGGRLPASWSRQQALNPYMNADLAAKEFSAEGGRGLTGYDAVSRFVTGFENPADKAGEISDSWRNYQRLQSGGLSTGTGSGSSRGGRGANLAEEAARAWRKSAEIQQRNNLDLEAANRRFDELTKNKLALSKEEADDEYRKATAAGMPTGKARQMQALEYAAAEQQAADQRKSAAQRALEATREEQQKREEILRLTNQMLDQAYEAAHPGRSRRADWTLERAQANQTRQEFLSGPYASNPQLNAASSQLWRSQWQKAQTDQTGAYIGGASSAAGVAGGVGTAFRDAGSDLAGLGQKWASDFSASIQKAVFQQDALNMKKLATSVKQIDSALDAMDHAADRYWNIDLPKAQQRSYGQQATAIMQGQRTDKASAGAAYAASLLDSGSTSKLSLQDFLKTLAQQANPREAYTAQIDVRKDALKSTSSDVRSLIDQQRELQTAIQSGSLTTRAAEDAIAKMRALSAQIEADYTAILANKGEMESFTTGAKPAVDKVDSKNGLWGGVSNGEWGDTKTWTSDLIKGFDQSLDKHIGKNPLGQAITSGLGNALSGQISGGINQGISQLASMVGGGLGGTALSAFLGPIGGFVGGQVGGWLGNLFGGLFGGAPSVPNPYGGQLNQVVNIGNFHNYTGQSVTNLGESLGAGVSQQLRTRN